MTQPKPDTVTWVTAGELTVQPGWKLVKDDPDTVTIAISREDADIFARAPLGRIDKFREAEHRIAAACRAALSSETTNKEQA